MSWAEGDEVVSDDDRIEWEGPLAWCMRPVSYGTLRRSVRTGSIFYVLAGAAGLPLVLGLIDVDGADRVALGVAVAISLYAAMVNIVTYERSSPAQIRRRGPVFLGVAHVLTPVLLAYTVVASGPNLTTSALLGIPSPIYAFFMLRTRAAIGVLVATLTAYGVALQLVDGQPAPLAHWIVMVTAATGTALLVGELARGTDEARDQLADLNRHLEERVAEQVDELERVGQLRRFLAPQVADVVVERGREELLEPHRRDVAVLFVDLRGFTRFTNAVDADTVVGALGDYYAAAGSVLEAQGATIGGYDGDGIMAYLGDPIPLDDPAAAGVATARELAGALDELTARWRTEGHDLGYGIGLTFGTATLGVVGFDGRFDYTPLGAVVNLSARLCSDAAPGEIVIDESVRRAAGPWGARKRGPVQLKGYDDPVITYTLRR